MELNNYSVTILEGDEVEGGYVEMFHGENYKIKLENHNDTKCDAEIHIDGKHVGTWRINEHRFGLFERPANDTGKFTFYRLGTSEARSSEIEKNEQTGLITVIFKPERVSKPFNKLSIRETSRAGGTGLSDKSEQLFNNDLDFECELSLGDDYCEMDFESDSVSDTSSRAGGTGLSGKSEQHFDIVSPLVYNIEKQTTIHLRLIAAKDQPRPLKPLSTPIPPPVFF